MTNKLAMSALIVLATAGCQPAATAPDAATVAVTEAEAASAFDATAATWGSMDAAKIKALYAPDVAGFDVTSPGLVTDRAAWDKNQDAFAASKLDKVTVTDKKIQLLGPDAFVVTSYSEGTSTAMPKNNAAFRCTDVFMRDAAGKWPIVNEHCSFKPAPV